MGYLLTRPMRGSRGLGQDLSDLIYNAATGDLSQSQVANLDAQNPGATSDINAALSSFSGTGALGLNWTGAQPGQAFYNTPFPGLGGLTFTQVLEYGAIGLAAVLGLMLLMDVAK